MADKIKCVLGCISTCESKMYVTKEQSGKTTLVGEAVQATLIKERSGKFINVCLIIIPHTFC